MSAEQRRTTIVSGHAAERAAQRFPELERGQVVEAIRRDVEASLREGF